MKLSIAFVVSTFLSSAAMAGPLDFLLNLPPHQTNGYRDTGCDVDAQVAIKNADGDTLYWNNPTCPDVGGAGFVIASSDPVDTTDDDNGDDSGDDNGGPSDDDNGGGTDDTGNDDDDDGNNGHGNDDDGDDDSNPGKGDGKGPKK